MPSLRRALLASGAAALIAGGLALSSPLPASAGVPRDLLASTGDSLIAFASSDPDANAVEIPLTGAPVDAFLLGIDVRPATQVLYGVFTLEEGELAVGPIDHATGAVGTLVTLSNSVGGGTIGGQLSAVGVDFNPVVDRLRVVSNFDDNLRIDVDSGVTTVDADLNGNQGGGDTQCVVGAAYTNSTPGPAAASTQLFDIVDGSCPFTADFLAIQAPPNDGTLTPVGPLGIDSDFEVGFEITAAGTGFLATRLIEEEVVPGGRSADGAAPKRRRGVPVQPLQLYSVSLASGAATLVGTIGTGFTGDEVDGLTSMPVQLPVTTTTATTLATSTTGAVLSSTTVVLARTGDEETAQGALGVVLIAAGATALLLGARMRRRTAG